MIRVRLNGLSMGDPLIRDGYSRGRWPVAIAVALALLLVTAPAASARNFSAPTYSSPITLSADGRFVWSVNPGADTVSVISTRTNTVIRQIKVGDEPRSVA